MEVKKRGIICVVLALFLAILSSLVLAVDQEGCYYYPQASEDVYCMPGILNSEAQADCAKHPGCNFEQYFIPGSDCSDSTLLPNCQNVICNVDCQTHALGKCTEMGGIAVPAVASGEPDPWCNLGCCKYTYPSGKEPFCQANLNRYQCELSAKQKGVTDPQKIVFDNSFGMNADKCNQQYCKVEVILATLTVTVKDTENQPIPEAQINVEGQTQTTSALGEVQFKLTPKTYTVTASKEGYASQSKVVPLTSNLSLQLNFNLASAEAGANLKGYVHDKEDQPISHATISWGEGTGEKAVTDEQGNYNIPGLSADQTYNFMASAVGYASQTVQIKINKGENAYPFILEPAAQSSLQGKTYLDKNSNNQSDDPEEIIYGAKIYVDGKFVGYSKYPDGSFQFDVNVNSTDTSETHTVSATYQDYTFNRYEFKIRKGEVISFSLLLIKPVGECTLYGTNPQKEVSSFTAQPVLGKKQVLLGWEKPCSEVIGYTIEKLQGTEVIDTIKVSPAEITYLDTEVEWQETYTYRIIANYDGLQSESPAEQEIILGDEPCEGKYHPLPVGWETFCFGEGADTRKVIWTCDDQNKLVPASDCAELDGQTVSGITQDYYCAKVSETEASCKDSGSCDLFSDPFGLYSSKLSCYFGQGESGDITQEKPRNYCYYEKTNSIVDSCKSCAKVSSCFDFSSQEACLYNNCLSHNCSWISGAANDLMVDYGLILPQLVTSETGAGYCVDPNYQKDDRCYLCSSSSTLFENYYCTAQVCSGLGNCFSADKLSRCQSCGDAPTKEANCYTYNTEAECTGGQAIISDEQGRLTLSEDRCGWGRCVWKGESGGIGTCVKDSDVDGEEDCLSFADAGQSSACKIDNLPPQTKLLNPGINRISIPYSNVTFTAQDLHVGKNANPQQNNALSKLYYCLTPADPNTPDTCLQNVEVNNFDQASYPGKLSSETITLDLLKATSLIHALINGKTYKLKYYSTDKYFNREQLQETFVYIDNVPPEYSINYENTTTGDLTSLTIYLEGPNEPMACNFTLTPIFPMGTIQNKFVPLESQDKKVTFDSLPGIMYSLSVSCTDALGNAQTKGMNLTFDKQQEIDLVYPTLGQTIAKSSIPFQVRTLVGATCSLYHNNEKVADFKTDEVGKEHQTEAIPNFIEKEYFNEYKVVCKELLTDKSVEDYFHFSVDFTAPSTSISLREGQRIETPSGYGWELYFVHGAEITLECTSQGFSCAQTRYCLGEGCELVGSPDYVDYQTPFSLNQSSKVCYYSIDSAGNEDFQSLCGQVIINGYGITLELPKPYYYHGEIWGFSVKPTFDWQIYTKVPTTQCGFDFNSGFRYDLLPEHKLRLINEDHKYLFSNFPESVFSTYPNEGGVKTAYVVCNNSEGELGPEQKMNLEYDPSAPQILENTANPNPIYEELFTTLSTTTDDKTFCHFSDNSNGEGSREYLTMRYSFPGEETQELETNHYANFSIIDVGDTGKRDYQLLVQCMNGPGSMSDLSELNLLVDYTSVGFIYASSLSPRGYLSNRSVDLSLSTSKTASCVFRDGNAQSLEYTSFSTSNNKDHYFHLDDLNDGYYKYPVQCVMGDHQAEAAIDFMVDTTSPVITGVEDGNYSCGSDLIQVMVYSSEANLSRYYYEVYDLGEDKDVLNNIASVNLSLLNRSSTQSLNDQISAQIKKYNASVGSTTKILIYNNSVPPTLPLMINTSSLNLTHRYSVKVKAEDVAGNWGEFKESNGVSIVDTNFSICQVDTTSPKVSIVMNDSCSLALPLVELRCEDDTGCKNFKYGISLEANSCSVNQTYNGNKISLKQKSWLCYSVFDNTQNNNSGKELIDIKDGDGDGVIDRCDNCSGTGANKVVDLKGCSSQDLLDKANANASTTDSDKDGLPDNWEKKHNQESCLFDYLLFDSDGNGVSDSKEDYDDDGYTNHQEYVYNTDPCSAADVPPIPLSGLEVPSKGITNLTLNKTTAPSNLLGEVPSTSGGSLLSWIILIVGLLLVLGGSGYLVYYYKYSPGRVLGARPSSEATYYPSESTGAPVEVGWGSKLLRFKKSSEEKTKQRTRENIFSEFTSKSVQIPHVDPLLSVKGAPELKLQQVAEKYVEHKEEIHPGLKPQEKTLFAKLESLVQKDKPISEQLGKEEAKDLFNKLKNLSQKRKGK